VRAALVLAALAGLFACAAATRPTAAAFTASSTATGSYTVDRLGNTFAVAPGSSTRPGASAPIAAGDVDTQTLTFGAVPSAQTFASVFTVRNTTGQAQQAVLSLAGAPQLATPVFASTGTPADTIPAGATRTVAIATSSTVAGRGAGTVRLRLGSSTWLYRDYATTIDLAPQAPASLTATPRAVGAIRLEWSPSSTVTGLAGYDVYRRSGAGAYAKLNATPLAAASYDDSATADGTTYTYVVRALTTSGVTLSSLDSPAATSTADATPPAGPTAVALANGGGDGDAWINAANAASVSVAVTLPAGSLASDTITVTLTSGSGSVSKTASGGAGTVTVTGIDARGIADGTVTISAASIDAAGNSSAARAADAPKDTVVPAAPTAGFSDGNGHQADSISGTAEPNAAIRAVRILPAPPLTFATTASASGAFEVSVAADKKVSVTYGVYASDGAGNTSPPCTITSMT
jgi:hypothetical protein